MSMSFRRNHNGQLIEVKGKHLNKVAPTTKVADLQERRRTFEQFLEEAKKKKKEEPPKKQGLSSTVARTVLYLINNPDPDVWFMLRATHKEIF